MRFEQAMLHTPVFSICTCKIMSVRHLALSAWLYNEGINYSHDCLHAETHCCLLQTEDVRISTGNVYSFLTRLCQCQLRVLTGHFASPPSWPGQAPVIQPCPQSSTKNKPRQATTTSQCCLCQCITRPKCKWHRPNSNTIKPQFQCIRQCCSLHDAACSRGQ